MNKKEIIKKNKETSKKIFNNKEKLNNIKIDLNEIENILYSLNFYNEEQIKNKIFKLTIETGENDEPPRLKIDKNNYYIRTFKNLNNKYNLDLYNYLNYRNIKKQYLNLYDLIQSKYIKDILNDNYNLLKNNIK